MPIVTDGEGRSFYDDGMGNLTPTPDPSRSAGPQAGSAQMDVPTVSSEYYRPTPAPMPAVYEAPGSGAPGTGGIVAGMGASSSPRPLSGPQVTSRQGRLQPEVDPIEGQLRQRADREGGSYLNRFGKALGGESVTADRDKLIAYQMNVQKRQQDTLKTIIDIAAKTASVEDHEEREALRRTVAPILYAMGRKVGLDMTPGMADAATSSPEFGQKLTSVLNDDPLMDKKAQSDLDALLKSKAVRRSGDLTLKVVDRFIEERAKAIRSGTVQIEGQDLPFDDLMAAAVKAAKKTRDDGLYDKGEKVDPKADITVGEVMQTIGRHPMMGKSRILREAVSGWMRENGRSFGVVDSAELKALALEEAKAGGRKKSPEEQARAMFGQDFAKAAGVLFPGVDLPMVTTDPGMKAVAGAYSGLHGDEVRGFFLGQWEKAGRPMDPKAIPKLVAAANEDARRAKIQTAAQSGASRVVLEQQAKVSMPFIDSEPWLKGFKFINKGTLQEDTSERSRSELSRDSSVKLLDPKQMDAVQALKETYNHLHRWEKVISEMPSGVAGKFDTFKAWMENKLGVANWATEMEALESTIIRAAGALQGSRVQLSDNDFRVAKKAFPGMWNSKEQADLIIGITRGMFRDAQRALMGEISQEELNRRTGEAARKVSKPPELNLGSARRKD